MAPNRTRSWLVISAVVAAITLIWSGSSPAVSARTRFIDSDRIVSFDAFDSLSDLTAGEMCPWPGSTASDLAAAPQQAGSGAAATTNWPMAGLTTTGPRIGTRAGAFDRKPARYIHDPNPAFSAIAVNAENDMVIIADENNDVLLEYSRRENTRPGGRPATPRRAVGGLATHVEMPCGVYLDPKTLETFALSNDTQNWMAVFSREAKGNAKPDRVLATPHSTWGIAADEIRQEIFLTLQGPNAVIVYRKTAAGTEVPLRILQGEATELADPQGIAVDAKNNLLFVANHGARELSSGGPPPVTRAPEEWRQAWQAAMGRAGMHGFVGLTGGRGQGRGQGQGPDLSSLTSNELQGPGQGGGSYGRFELPSINIFALGASGNTAPLRVIKGPQTQLNWPHHVAVHEDRGEIFVANNGGDAILVFRTSDSGDVTPTRVIKGPRTGIKYPAGIALDVRNGELWVANMGNYTATVYPITANGDVPPVRTIRAGPQGGLYNMMGNPGSVAYDNRRQEILVPN